MKVLLAYFSFTGNTEKVGNLISKCLEQRGIDLSSFRIEPVFNLPYLLWLLLSFIPALPFPIKGLRLLNLAYYDVIILGTPKWTFNCPPVTSFIRFLGRAFNSSKCFPKIAVFLTYGGFDEDAYLGKLEAKFKKMGFEIIAMGKFKRSYIQQNKIEEDIYRFCAQILSSINPSDINYR